MNIDFLKASIILFIMAFLPKKFSRDVIKKVIENVKVEAKRRGEKI